MTDTQTLPATQTPASSTPRSNGALTVPENGEKPKAGYGSSGAFELMQRAANALSKSSLVPKDYQNNIPNCMIALGIAHRVGADPMMVMQNLDIIHGRPSWRAQFMIGTANSCGRFSAIRYEFFGEPNTDSWGCRASATEKSTGEKLVGPDITIAMTKKEGWYAKAGSKWQTMPQLMLMYRSGAWWVRAYAPELSLGFHTAEEVVDILDATPQNDGSYRVDHLKQAQAMLGARQDPPHDQTTGEIVEAGTEEPDDETEGDEDGEFSESDELDRYIEKMRGELALAKTPIEANAVDVTFRDTLDGYVERKEITEQRGTEITQAWGEATRVRAAELLQGKRK